MSLNNGVQINTIMLSFVKDHPFDVGPLSDLEGRWSCLCRLGECIDPTFRLCHHMGSSGGIQGL